MTKVINDVEKSNEAANNDEKAATVKDDNLSKLSVVTGYDPVDPNPMSVATTIYGKYYDMKEVQEEAYAALTTAYDAKFALFAPVKETIKASTVTYLDTDKEELTNAETEILTDWISGQNSDGYGEHFEQQPIDTEDGDLYVSFWNSGDNYSIMTRDELDEYIDNQGMTMGGM